jgi:hypothetical protein
MPAVFENFAAGQVSDDPLTQGATTINSAGFAVLPEVVAPDFLWLSLDPDGVDGTPEVVKVTAHAASATSVTVVRGEQGTVAREHDELTIWRHAWTAADGLGLDSVGTAQLQNGAVTTAKIGDSQVTTAKIGDSQVTTAKIGDSQVTNAKIANNAVTSAKIGTNQVTATEIADGAVGPTQLATNAVTTVKIGDNQVTSAKIQANAVGASEFRNSVQRSVVGRPGTGTGEVSDIVVGDNRVLGRTTGNLGGVQVTSAMIGTNQVTASEIADGAVGATQLASNAVTNAKIANGAVTSAKIGTNQVTNSEIASSTILAGNIANGAVTEAKLDSAGSSVSSASGWSNGILCKRIGNTVWLSGTAVRTGGNVSGLSTAGTIPAGFRPGTAPTDRGAPTSSSNIRTFRVTTAGLLQINGSSTNEVTTIDICYLV